MTMADLSGPSLLGNDDDGLVLMALGSHGNGVRPRSSSGPGRSRLGGRGRVHHEDFERRRRRERMAEFVDLGDSGRCFDRKSTWLLVSIDGDCSLVWATEPGKVSLRTWF